MIKRVKFIKKEKCTTYKNKIVHSDPNGGYLI